MVAYRLDRDLMNSPRRIGYVIRGMQTTFRVKLRTTDCPFRRRSATSRQSAGRTAFGFPKVGYLGRRVEINPEKVWFSGPKARKEVTGLMVNEFTNVKRSLCEPPRRIVQSRDNGGRLGGRGLSERYKSDSSLEQVLRGRLEWIAQVRGRSFSAYRTLAKGSNQQFPDSAFPILPTYAEIAERAVWVLEFYSGVCEQGTAFPRRCGIGDCRSRPRKVTARRAMPNFTDRANRVKKFNATPFQPPMPTPPN